MSATVLKTPVYTEKIFTILNGATLSDAQQVGAPGRRAAIIGIRTPAALTGTTLKFKASNKNNSDFLDVYTPAGVQVSVTVAADRHIPIVPIDLLSIGYLKVVSGTAEGADRTITLIIERL